MPNEYFKTCYSVADPEELKSELVNRYGFKAPLDCRIFKSGINDIYFVKADGIIYYLRIANNGSKGYSLIDYKEEANIMLSLNENGINMAVPVCCNDGEYVWSINAPEGIRYAILFSEAKNNPSDDKIKINFNLGQSLAKVHTVSDEKGYKVSRMPIDFTQLTDRPLELLKPYLNLMNPDDYKFICDFMAELKEYISGKLLMQKPYYGFCHGDAQMDNIFFQKETPTYFDFDCMGYGWRSYDISSHVLHMEIQNPEYRKSEEYKAYLDGYNSIRQLSENEIDCIIAFNSISSMWTIGLNITMFEKRMGFSRIENFVNAMPRIFRTWHEKFYMNK